VNVIAIVQARMSSTRLPGKVLLPFGERPMIGWVFRQLSWSKMLTGAVLATSEDASDDRLCSWAADNGVPVSRGSLHDVLDRFDRAAEAREADIVVRITGDCPLIDPLVVDAVVAAYCASYPPADYASNVSVRTYPRGLDVEVFGRNALREAVRGASKAYEREHVTPFLYEHPDRFRLLSVENRENLSQHRWTVDTPEDAEFVRQIISRIPHDPIRWQDVLTILREEPSLTSINEGIRQQPLHP
jgi:spore coat polysaccharide biosynthesis protein SpsF (cytidylyltransferase family)